VTQHSVTTEDRRPRSEVSPAVLGTARSLRLDRVASEVVAKLDGAGIDSLVLKGPVHAQWLYDDGTPRTYCDIDIMVPPRERDRATNVLLSLGFEDPATGFRSHERCGHADTYVRPPGIDKVDLHHCLAGVTVDADLAWSVLRASAATAVVGGAPVRTLAPAARTMHVALHAAQHGVRGTKTRNELARAVRMVDIETWQAAGELAVALGAGEAMAAGLRLVDDGDLIAQRLRLPAEVSRRVAAQAFYTARGTRSLVAFLDAPTLRTKLGVVRHRTVPSPAMMRAKSPTARRGPVGLAAAYVLRWLFMARQAPVLWRDYRLVVSSARLSTADRAAGNRSSSA